MNKEQLKKLAEVAGKSIFQMMDYDGMKSWQPHKNIEQAFQVIDNYDYFISRYKTLLEGEPCPYFEVDIEVDKKEYSAMAETLPEAICKAVLKAVDHE